MNAMKTPTDGAVVLRGRTAEDLMSPNPVSLREDIPLREAIAFLVDRGISGAPVIDEAGRPVGVLTQSDILVHDREEAEHFAPPEAEFGAPLPPTWWDSFQIERVDTTPVRDVMTPAVFCVALDTPARKVIEQMRQLNVHRLFVTDEDGVMVGVITAMDIVRNLALID
jgi:predicted transcriptional regulator